MTRQRPHRCPLHPGTGCIERRKRRDPGGASVYGCCKLPLRQPGMEARCPAGAGQRQPAGSVHDSPGSRREVARPELQREKKDLKAIIFIVLPTPTPTQASIFLTQLLQQHIPGFFNHRHHRRRVCAGGAFPGRQPEGMTRFSARKQAARGPPVRGVNFVAECSAPR